MTRCRNPKEPPLHKSSVPFAKPAPSAKRGPLSAHGGACVPVSRSPPQPASPRLEMASRSTHDGWVVEASSTHRCPLPGWQPAQLQRRRPNRPCSQECHKGVQAGLRCSRENTETGDTMCGLSVCRTLFLSSKIQCLESGPLYF